MMSRVACVSPIIRCNVVSFFVDLYLCALTVPIYIVVKIFQDCPYRYKCVVVFDNYRCVCNHFRVVYIHFHIMFMRKCDSFFQCPPWKSSSLCAESKCFSSDINRICSKMTAVFNTSRLLAGIKVQDVLPFISFLFFTLTATPSPSGIMDVVSSSWCFNSYRYSRILE